MTDENKIRDVIDAVTGVAKAVPAMSEYTTKGAYDALDNDPSIKARIDEIENAKDIHHVIEHKYLRVTELGKQFANICVIRKS